MSGEKKKKEKDQHAEEIARIMVENMKANMADPDFWEKRERRRQKALDEVLKKRKERKEFEIEQMIEKEEEGS
jgi:hypothetical protein